MLVDIRMRLESNHMEVVAVEPSKFMILKAVNSRVVKVLHMSSIGKTRADHPGIFGQSSQGEASLVERVLSWQVDGLSTTRAV